VLYNIKLLTDAKEQRAELIPDAHLAVLAMEYGLILCSSDTDFDRLPGLVWRNPLVPTPP